MQRDCLLQIAASVRLRDDTHVRLISRRALTQRGQMGAETEQRRSNQADCYPHQTGSSVYLCSCISVFVLAGQVTEARPVTHFNMQL